MSRLAALFAFLVLLVVPAAAFADPIVVKDILGREVKLEKPATRIVLGQGRHMRVLALLTPDPVSLVVGWKDDFKRDKTTYAAFQKKFPAIDSIASVGQAGDASFSVEKTIDLKPDLVLLSLSVGEAADETMMRQIAGRLETAGIPVAFVDFFNRPLRDTQASVDILGKLIGREAQATAFLDFYREHLKKITDRITDKTPRPDVFMQVHAAGDSCCFSPGKGVFNDFIQAAGGHNIAADVLPGVAGKVSLEYLISHDPAFYIATGGAHMAARGGLVLGTGTNEATARASFDKLIAAPGIADLTAVKEKRAFGIWHLFNDTPSHIVMIELLAKWLHPELFADIDPAATIDELNKRFLAVPLDGTFWISEK